MSLIGQKVKVIRDGREITVRSEREINGLYVYTDENGDIYEEGELDIRYRLSPECIMFHALQKAGLYEDYYDYDFDVMHGIVTDFMDGMVRAKYIEDKRKEDEE